MTRKLPVKRASRALRSGPAQVRGIGLIEVMVSLVVLAIGLLGIAAMQSLALRGGQGSLESSQAVMQTTSVIEAMRANRANAAAYNIGKTCSVAAVAATGLVGDDLKAWIGGIKGTLGATGDAASCGEVSGCPNACVITVYWDDARAGPEAGGAARSVVTETRI